MHWFAKLFCYLSIGIPNNIEYKKNLVVVQELGYGAQILHTVDAGQPRPVVIHASRKPVYLEKCLKQIYSEYVEQTKGIITAQQKNKKCKNSHRITELRPEGRAADTPRAAILFLRIEMDTGGCRGREETDLAGYPQHREEKEDRKGVIP